MNRIFIFTASFPFSIAGENTFLPQELDKVSEKFDEIIILPIETDGEIFNYSKKNIKIDLSYAKLIKKKKINYFIILYLLFDYNLYYEFIKNFKYFIKYPSNLRKLIISVYNFKKNKNSLIKYFERFRKDGFNMFVLTWWFDQTTYVLSRLKPIINYKLFTRTHGYDLYENRVYGNYFPFRELTIKNLNYVFPDAQNGCIYLQNKYLRYRNKISYQPLGINDPLVSTNSTISENTFHLLSCSTLAPVKRINKIMEAIKNIKFDNNTTFIWTHIGNGSLYDSYLKDSMMITSKNIKINFLPYSNSKNLFDFYSNTEIDLFINVSESEGTPIAIMEAMSCGIPVLATNVGGNSEIVDNECGFLINVNFDNNLLSDLLLHIYKNKNILLQKKTLSRVKWEKNFNADINYDKTYNFILNK